MALNPLTGKSDYDLQSDLDAANKLALGPLYVPRDPSFSGEVTAPVGSAGAGFEPVPSLRAPEEAAPGADLRVSTRVPWSKPTLAELPIDPHLVPDYQANIAAARDSTNAYANNAAEFRGPGYPDLPVKGLRNPENINQAAINHMSDNLVWLHDKMVDTFGPEMVARASQWYDGANARVHLLADQYGYRPEQVAGAVANMSPQKDWFQNVSLAHRMIDIMASKGDQEATPEMQTWAQNYVNAAQAKANTPDKQTAADELQMSLSGMRGVPFSKINDPDTRALFLRAYDEAHNPRDYPIVTPEGDLQGPAMNQDGVTPTSIGWGSFAEIRKAMAALEAQDLPAISRTLGGQHKVRNFFNNLIAPDHGDDTTIDTHAIGATHLRPFTASDWQTEFGLGGTGSEDARTGMKGAYGIYHEAYARAAQQLANRGDNSVLYLPRQLQSIAWEGIRGMFPDWWRTTQNYNDNFDIWTRFRNGDITADQAREAVLQHAGGLRPPQWWTGPGPSIGPTAPTQ